ncbi:MAG: hypothetical protein WBD01_06200 [Salaquimonas sp.]
MKQKAHFYRQALAICVAIFLFILVVFTLEKTGIPRSYGIALTGVSLFILWVISTFLGATTTGSNFYLSGRSIRSTVNALAIMTAISFPVIIGVSGGIFVSNPSYLVVILIAMSVGIALSSLLAARQFYDTGSSDVAQYLANRYDSTLTAKTVAVAVALGGMGLAICGIATVYQLIAWFFNIGETSAISLAMLLIILTMVLGGAKSSTRLAAIAGVLVLIGINLPLLVNSISFSGFPLGHFTFGSDALAEMWDLEDQLSSLSIPNLKEVLTPLSPLVEWTGGQQIAAAFVIVAGIVFFPSVLQQYGISSDTENVSASALKAILFTGLLGASLIALLAFTQFGIYQTLLGLPLSEARISAPLLFSWGERNMDLLAICGTMAGSPNQLLEICPDGAGHVLSIQDMLLNSQLILPAAADLTALPFAYTALLTSAIILCGISFVSMILLATSNNLVSAFYFTLSGKVASGRIFASRISMTATSVLTAAYVYYYAFDNISLFLFSMSVLAATLVPAMAAAFFMPKVSHASVVSAVAVGFVIAVLYYVLSKYGIDFTSNTGDELQITLPGMEQSIASELSAIFAIPIAFLILVMGHLLQANAALNSSPPSDEIKPS